MLPPTDSGTPKSRKKSLGTPALRTNDLNSPSLRAKGEIRENGHDEDDPAKKKKKLWDLIALTISMAGAQVAWTVELGYGTPFLLGLGLSEQLTSLVWLAGPISGLIAQPLIVLVISALTLAYAQAIAAVLVDFFGGYPAQFDSNRKNQTKNTAIGLAVFSFYLLDFALNALQGSLRSLLLDVTPAEQLGKANAWHGRMIHAGNIIGFTFGFVNLAEWKILRPLGGDQFRKVCIVATAILVATVWLTCTTQHEKARERELGERESRSPMGDAARNIIRAVSTLPRPVRRVCYVQVCAFMGWFPFLFYSTTWVGEVMAYELDKDPDPDVATRAGEFALLIYSIVAVLAGTALPYLAASDARLLKQIDREIEDEEAVSDELKKIREMVRQWKLEAARQGKPLKLPTMPFMLRNIWTAALLLFGFTMMSTFFITTVAQATFAIALLGVCWAVACWVPFAIIMQFLREMDDSAAAERKYQANERNYASTSAANPRSVSLAGRPLHARIASTPTLMRHSTYDVPEPNERTGLIRRHSMLITRDLLEGSQEDMGYVGTQPVAGGTILGIHNLAIVVPQFLIALISSFIFRIVDQQRRGQEPGGPDYVYYGKNGVSWVLRFGGLCAFVGAAISRRVPPTKTEKEMRWRLAEMQEDERNELP
ncbi:hypothetical protein FRB99_005764 [Tulasnella sp. 403]|nr:hypothetical protein FRB99_005764 [Tulasnella sp. 403]